jgi:hypothetical protein
VSVPAPRAVVGAPVDVVVVVVPGLGVPLPAAGPPLPPHPVRTAGSDPAQTKVRTRIATCWQQPAITAISDDVPFG